MQVRGAGLYAAATREANPFTWRDAFSTFDANNDAMLDRAELEQLVSALIAEGALPETLFRVQAMVDTIAGHSSGRDAISFEEYLRARPGGEHNETSPIPVLPSGWMSGCKFGPVSTAGLAGWTAASSEVLVPSALAGEWIACIVPPAQASRAHMTLVQRFTAGEPLEGVKILQVGKLPDVQGAVPPPPKTSQLGSTRLSWAASCS